ncbi:MAG: hypothetical protein K8F91_00850 [Candidatus Obscuribacterales bacterium]|nr:hypothetical protein [Candidatus Obscuribacterales bacterium]
MKISRTALMCFIVLSIFAINDAGAADGDWKTMSAEGATVSFEMPEPIKMNEEPSQGLVVYASRKEKKSFKLSIVKRNAEEDKTKGLSDEQVLKTFASRVLLASKQQFAQMNMQTEFRPTGDLTIEGGLGQEYVGQVGKATVVNRFFVDQNALYFQEAISQDTENPDYKKFLASFKLK